MRDLTGLEGAGGGFISAEAHVQPVFDELTRLLGPLLGRYAAEGKSYLTIAVGCTGGRHRSVFVAGKLAQWLAKQDRPTDLRHRDLDKSAI